jgi:hypothetical protein
LENVQSFLLTCGYPGSEELFFESLAKYLSKILDSEYVCIDKLLGDGLTAETVAIYNEGKFDANVTYTLKETPCGEVVGKAICCFPENVCRLFPHDEALQELKAQSYIGTTLWSFDGKPIGLIAIIGQKPLKNADFAESVLKLVAIRAAGELERIQAEEVLQKNEERYRTVVASLTEGVILQEQDGRILTWNTEAERIFGLSANDVQGQISTTLSWEVFREDGSYFPAADHPSLKTLKTGEPCKNVVMGVRNFEGRFTWININTKALFKQNESEAYAVVVSFSDITEQKQAEDELRLAREQAEESEGKFRAYTEHSPIAVYTTDINGDCIYANAKWLEIAGLTLEESLGKGWSKALHPDDKESVFENWYKSVQSNGKWVYEYRFVTPQGKVSFVEGSAKPLFNKANKLIGYLGSNVDITKRKLAEQELIKAKEQAEESDRLKSAFLANMSHEIRTPMNGILGFSDLLKEPGLSGAQQQEYIRIIEKSGHRMLNIINDIVDISKIEAGLVKVDIQDTNINEKIEFVYAFFKPEVEAKGIRLSFKTTLPAKEATIKTDSEKVYAILTNLVKNASKYTKEGSIEFGYDRAETLHATSPQLHATSLRFYVKDTGIGIPSNRQEAIFERFVQAVISDKMARQGAGLGLAITKSFVEMLGGKIWVESEEGIGSTFYFTLPYNHEPEVKAIVKTLASAEELSKSTKKLKILIAEDDEASEMLITAMVDFFGKEILKVGTGLEAVEVCRNNPDIDLVLMDIQMPEMGGYEATRQIRQFNKDVVIIAQTAYGLSGDREKAIDAGCNDYIAKPINKVKLLALIGKHCKN